MAAIISIAKAAIMPIGKSFNMKLASTSKTYSKPAIRKIINANNSIAIFSPPIYLMCYNGVCLHYTTAYAFCQE